MSEQEVLAIIEKVASKLSWKFIFGAYSYEDIKQEAYIIAFRGLEKYEADLPLENFLWVHIKNRLCNLKREKFTRIDKPCLSCPLKAYIKKGDICTEFKDKMDCKLYSGWKTRNETKKNIAMPSNIGGISDNEPGICVGAPSDNLYNVELIELIDREISVECRSLWLKAKGGIKLLREEREMLKYEILEIFKENNVEEF